MASYSLPQNDKNQQRRAELEAIRSEYTYNNEYGVPISSGVRDRDKAGTLWTLKALKAMYKARSNLEAVLEATGWTLEKEVPQKSPLEVAALLKAKDMRGLFGFYLPDMGVFKGGGGRPKSIEDYKLLFAKVTPTYACEHFMDDAYFVHTFLAGPNPNMFRKMTELPKNFPLTQAHFQSSLPGDSLVEAIAAGRVYFVDYKDLSSLNAGKHPQGHQKYIYQPIVAFARAKTGNNLLPIAIQCGQDPAAFPMILPQNEWSWQMAKSTVWVAHHCYQEMLSHLGFTHLLIEPIVVAMRRHLHVLHPIYGLLAPHFEGTMPINALAITSLIQTGQAVDRLVGSEKQSNYALIASHRLAYSFTDNYLPNRLESMGVASSKDLPIYHYRDDGLPIWDAIKSWVSSYVEIYYPNEAAIRADAELQAWAAEIAATDGGKVKDFASNGGVRDRAQLIDTLTMIIFTAGPQHAAVNFPQFPEMSFVPGGPLSGYRPAPEASGMTEQDYLDLLPPLDVAVKQWQSLYFLGAVNYTTLGFYPAGNFLDPRVLAANAKFLLQLRRIESGINDRNKSRTPYEHLLPSRIPQSTNI